MDFKELIKVRRKELGLTLEEVAKACNVTKATVMRWENGSIVNIKKDKIYPLAKILKLDPFSLLDDEDGEVVETMTNEEKKELLHALKVVRNECKKHMNEKCNDCCLCTDEGCKLKIDAPRNWCLSNEKKDIWRAFN